MPLPPADVDHPPASLMAVHGNGGGGDRFRWMAPHLPHRIRLHAPTLPGFGGRPADPSITDVAGYATALAGELTALPRPRVVLGTGIGGSWALELLRHHADEVDGVILHAPVGPRLDRRLLPKAMQLPGVAEAARRAIANRYLRPLVARRYFSPDTPDNRVDAVLDAYDRCEAFAQQFAIITAGWWASLPTRTTPAVVLWGEDEHVLSADMATELRAVLPEAAIWTVPGWDHFPMTDVPAHYAAVVVRAVDAVLAAAPATRG